MLSRLINEVRNAPEKLADRGRDLSARARRRARELRGDGQERLWELQIDTLQRVEGLLDRPRSLPVVGRVAEAAERLVHKRFEVATALPIPDYDEANAKTITAALDELSRIELLRIRRYERSNKARKTVLAALDKAIDKLDDLPVEEAA